MTAHGFALFDTAIGRCGIAWGERGVVGVQLPEAREPETRARLLQRFPDAREAPPPPDVQRALDGIVGAAARRGERSLRRRARHGARAAVPPPRLRGRAHHSAGRDALVRRDRGAARRARLGARGGAGARAQSVRDRRALPSRARGRRQGRRLLRERRRRDEAAPARRSRARRRTGSRALFDGDGAFGFDPSVAVAHLRASDPALARVIDAVGPFRMRAQEDAEHLRRARRGDRLPAAHRQGRGDDLRARVRALPARARGPRRPSRSCAPPTRSSAAPACRAPKLLALRDLAQRAADGEIPTLAEVAAHGRRGDHRAPHRRCAASAAGPWRCC